MRGEDCRLRQPTASLAVTAMRTRFLLLASAMAWGSLGTPGILRAAPASPPSAAPAPAPSHVRRALTGHVTNYDEAKVGQYRLPDPLQLAGGAPVNDAETWFNRRRPEIVAAYEELIFGREPMTTPAVRPEVLAANERVADGAGLMSHVVLHFGDDANGPRADVVLVRPARAGKSPVLLQLVFRHGLPSGQPGTELPAAGPNAGAAAPETGPVAEILRRGYAYATFRYTDVQPDNATTGQAGVAALAQTPGHHGRAPDEWGTLTIWAWAASRVLDYLSTVPDLDATRVALIGHSRLGKTVLWASARDPRFALVFSSCSGEMGAALSRRDFGESIDDMAERFPWQFAPNFQRFAGHWSSLPVDAHLLIALSAPRPVFITGGTEDQWADPRGEFLAEVAAAPVYKLLGREGMETTEWPGADHPLTTGSLGWNYHTGPHAILPEDWQAFLDFADRHLQASRPRRR